MAESRPVRVQLAVRLEVQTAMDPEEVGRLAENALREELRRGPQLEIPGVGYARILGTDCISWDQPGFARTPDGAASSPTTRPYV